MRFRPAGAEDRIETRNSKLLRVGLVKHFERMESEDSHIIASDWLLWLNQNRSLVNSNPTNLASLLPLIHQPQLRPEASSITTLRVSFAHLSSPNPFNNSGSNGSATASDIIHDSRLGTPQATLVGLARGPCLRQFSPRTFRPLRRFRTPNSLSDHCQSWPTTTITRALQSISIDSVPPSQFRVPPPGQTPVPGGSQVGL